MANKLKMVTLLRQRTTDMIAAFQDASALAQEISALGWTADDLDAGLQGTGSDVTGREIIDALAALGSVAQAYASQGAAILKLRE